MINKSSTLSTDKLNTGVEIISKSESKEGEFSKVLDKKIVCLGGGIGTVNLIKGLKNYTSSITIIISMADEGGSSGRLRRLYNIPPPGDMISCMSALVKTDGVVDKGTLLQKMLTYRFPGDRYGKDNELSGHKLGNLMFVAMRDITGDFNEAISVFQELFEIPGTFLPVTSKSISITATTVDCKKVYGEENIDLGKYDGKKILEKITLSPGDIGATQQTLKAIDDADVIIAGPGDLYTTILPVLMVPGIKEALMKKKKDRFFIINIANKPFETKDYKVADYIEAIKKHLGIFPFDKIIVNDNFSIKIPKKFQYKFVGLENIKSDNIEIIKRDLVERDFPLYHDSAKLAKALIEKI